MRVVCLFALAGVVLFVYCTPDSYAVSVGAWSVQVGHAPAVAGATVVQRDTHNPDDMTLRRPPSISAQQIDDVLRSYNSPAVGSGADFVSLGEHYGIDPAYPLAFFIHESTAGTNPAWAGNKGNGQSTHNIGNIICTNTTACYNGFRDYASWHDGIEDWYKLLTTEYIPNGRATAESVIPVYCPTSDGCDVAGYTAFLHTTIAGWRAAQAVTQSVSSDAPHSNPLRSPHTVMTQGYGVGSHAPAATWGAVDLTLGSPEATYGAPIYATLHGVVHLYPNSTPGGNCVKVENTHWHTLDCHLSAFVAVEGQAVNPGDEIGKVGSTGQSSGPHLHHEVHHDGVNVNPLEYGVLED